MLVAWLEWRLDESNVMEVVDFGTVCPPELKMNFNDRYEAAAILTGVERASARRSASRSACRSSRAVGVRPLADCPGQSDPVHFRVDRRRRIAATLMARAGVRDRARGIPPARLAVGNTWPHWRSRSASAPMIDVPERCQ